VVGVYSGSTHVRCESGPLLVVVAPGVALSPNGLAVEVGPHRMGPDAGFRVGQTVELTACESVGGGRPRWTESPDSLAADWRVVLEGAATWEPRPGLALMPRRALSARLRLARQTVLADGARAPLLPLLWVADGGVAAGLAETGRLAWAPARRLGEAAVRGDARAVADAARGLAGLGPGLTPSGDDLLAGFAAAWTLVGQSLGLGGAPRRRVTEALVAGGEAGASPLGRAWLEHAARGELAEPMTRFVETLGGAESRDVVPATRDVLGVGAASGTDWMVGFLLGSAGVLAAPRRKLSPC
jgi:hypothetical protein